MAKIKKLTEVDEKPQKKTRTVLQKIVDISNELRLKKEGKNTYFNYFKPDEILLALNPILQREELITIFNLPYNENKRMYEGNLIIMDVDKSDYVEYWFDIPMATLQGKQSPGQEAGATMTYCKRYMLMNAFNIADNSADLDAKNYNLPKNVSTFGNDIPVSNKCSVCDADISEKVKSFSISKYHKALCMECQKKINK